MINELSNLSGDADNDGMLTPADASVILKDNVGLANCANPNMADFNGDGSITPADASAILRNIVGLD